MPVHDIVESVDLDLYKVLENHLFVGIRHQQDNIFLLNDKILKLIKVHDKIVKNYVKK